MCCFLVVVRVCCFFGGGLLKRCVARAHDVFLFCVFALVKTWFHAAQRLVGSTGRMGSDPSWSASSSGQVAPGASSWTEQAAARVQKEANKGSTQPRPQQHSPPPLQQPSSSPESVAALCHCRSFAVGECNFGVGEDNPHARPLLEALKVAKSQATIPRSKTACKAYLERARKRVARADADCQSSRAEVDLR